MRLDNKVKKISFGCDIKRALVDTINLTSDIECLNTL